MKIVLMMLRLNEAQFVLNHLKLQFTVSRLAMFTLIDLHWYPLLSNLYQHDQAPFSRAACHCNPWLYPYNSSLGRISTIISSIISAFVIINYFQPMSNTLLLIIVPRHQPSLITFGHHSQSASTMINQSLISAITHYQPVSWTAHSPLLTIISNYSTTVNHHSPSTNH